MPRSDDNLHPAPLPAIGRGEVDPAESAEPPDQSEAPAESGRQLAPNSPDVQREIDALIETVTAGDASNADQRLVRDLITAALKLIPDGRDTGELKLMTAAVKELRYAFRIFGQYPDPRKVSIFGSSRTPAGHPDYETAVEFSRQMAGRGWMVITGAGGGIMQAGHEGPGRGASFGVAIRLPFEQETNEIIRGDEKLVNFRYFFTRKVMFLSQSDAVVCFPGGFGTLDEAFETLTLIQTGKAAMVPLVLMDGEDAGEGHSYWNAFVAFLREQLLRRGMIDEADLGLFHLASGPEDAAEHICQFYRNYESYRYVRDDLVISIKRPLTAASMEKLNEEFGVLVAEGSIQPSGPYEVETRHRDLPRIAFTHTRRDYGLVRRLIDRINTLPTEEADAVPEGR